MYFGTWSWTPCIKGIDVDAPSAAYTTILAWRHRSVRNFGIQIKQAVAKPQIVI